MLFAVFSLFLSHKNVKVSEKLDDFILSLQNHICEKQYKYRYIVLRLKEIKTKFSKVREDSEGNFYVVANRHHPIVL